MLDHSKVAAAKAIGDLEHQPSTSTWVDMDSAMAIGINHLSTPLRILTLK